MDSILLDTHTFIWLSEDDPDLPPSVLKIIDNAENVFVSTVSFWEIAIKLNVGKITLKDSFLDIENRFNATRLILLPVSIEDSVQLHKLPFIKEHKDPFDKLLVSQAISRSMPIISVDPHLDVYPVQRVWK
jgi:PIN domain nuclease of toxin-antitoxin system